MLQTTSKDEQKVVLKKLKEEQRRKMALLGEQYEQTIAEMLQKQSVGRTTIYLPFNERRTSLECCVTADPAGRVAGARGGPAVGPAAARAGDPHRLPEQEQDGGGQPAGEGEARAGGAGETQ